MGATFLKALESLFDCSSGTEHEFKFGLFTQKKKKKIWFNVTHKVQTFCTRVGATFACILACRD